LSKSTLSHAAGISTALVFPDNDDDVVVAVSGEERATSARGIWTWGAAIAPTTILCISKQLEYTALETESQSDDKELEG
jgi:hypothetical protein